MNFKKYPTDADIAEMKARGYDSETVNQSVRMKELGESAAAVITLIEEAFRDVRLGNGTGLREAQGLDDHEDVSTCARYREQDEKDDWHRIPVEILQKCQSSLSFFDSEGMRFHLPAYLVADLKGELGVGITFCLTHSGAKNQECFALLSPEQRLSIRRYLLHALHDPDNEFGADDIQRALETCWA